MRRTLVLLSMLLVTVFTDAARTDAGETIVRLDLDDRAAFRSALDLGIEARFRWGNTFLCDASREQLRELVLRNIPHRVLDDRADASIHYITPGASIERRPYAVAAGSEPIGEVGGATLWRSPSVWETAGYDCPRCPMRLPDVSFPLVYRPVRDVAPNDRQLVRAAGAIDSIVAAISTDTLRAYVQRMQDFQTRLAMTDSAAAAMNWMLDTYAGFGYSDVRTDTFWVEQGQRWYGPAGWDHNVICIKPGTAEPDKVIVVGGHWDSIAFGGGTDPFVWAPGADDNASGACAAMELARVFANIPTKRSIYFMGFGDEEDLMIGSTYFANRARQQLNTDITFMINMDMIGYNESSLSWIPITTNEASRPVAEMMRVMGETHTWLTPYVEVDPAALSDQFPFMMNGYDYAYVHENVFNIAGWHTNIDIVDRFDLSYYTAAVQMVGAAVYAIAMFPTPVEDLVLWDVGDG